jgi:hypothetical protein
MFAPKVATNASNLRKAIILGCVAMEDDLDRTRGSLPFFLNIVAGKIDGHAFGNSHAELFSLAHMPGRFLDALLTAESVGLYRPAPATIEALRRWAIVAVGGPVALPRNIDTDSLEPLPRVLLHNLREGLHALSALVRFRDDEDARRLAVSCVRTMDAYFQDGVWDGDRLLADTGIETMERWDGDRDRFTWTLGRAIGPLVKLARDCGIGEAGELAERLGRYAVERVFLADGSFDVARHGAHGHSVTSTLSSLALLADFTGDSEILQRVSAFVENGLRDISLDFGWCLENVESGSYVGEGNNTADIVETLLVLARRDPGRYDSVERILRSHLLPSQLIDVGFISDDLATDNGLRKLASRTLGAFGFPLPYGHEEHPGAGMAFNWDVVGGVVPGLCDVVREQVTFRGATAEVNLLFDHSSDGLTVRGPYDGAETVLIEAGPGIERVSVRLPTWADRDALGRWARDSGAELGTTHLILDTVRSRYEIPTPLPAVRREYRFRDMAFTADYSGDQIVAMSAPDKRLRFFDPPLPDEHAVK